MRYFESAGYRVSAMVLAIIIVVIFMEHPNGDV